jgi:hypothetical protein
MNPKANQTFSERGKTIELELESINMLFFVTAQA